MVNEYPKLVVLSFGFAFSQLAAKMLVKTITYSETFYQDTLTNNLVYFMILSSLFLKQWIGVVFLDYSLILGFVLNTLGWFVYINRLTNEIADILGIYRFTVGKRDIKTE